MRRRFPVAVVYSNIATLSQCVFRVDGKPYSGYRNGKRALSPLAPCLPGWFASNRRARILTVHSTLFTPPQKENAVEKDISPPILTSFHFVDTRAKASAESISSACLSLCALVREKRLLPFLLTFRLGLSRLTRRHRDAYKECSKVYRTALRNLAMARDPSKQA